MPQKVKVFSFNAVNKKINGFFVEGILFSGEQHCTSIGKMIITGKYLF